MYCSGCGQAIEQGQTFCSRCGRPMAVAPPVPGMGFQLDAYAGKIRALSIVWFIYAGLTLALSFMGFAFARALIFRHFAPWPHGPWMNGPFRPEWFGPVVLQFVWVFALLYAALLFAAAWGLMERTSWGRIAAIVAAFLNLFKFPFGTALGIWTLVTLMGYRNQTLYERLPGNGL
jgi:zinc-ribbon domain